MSSNLAKELSSLFISSFKYCYFKLSIKCILMRGQRMCPAARSKSEVLSYASWDGKKVERGRVSF